MISGKLGDGEATKLNGEKVHGMICPDCKQAIDTHVGFRFTMGIMRCLACGDKFVDNQMESK